MARSNAYVRLIRDVASAIRPPETLSYSEWAAKNFMLSPETSAEPGRFRPWKPQAGILDAIGDPLLESVDIIKSARAGYTTSLVAAIGAVAANDPCPIILLMPTDDDARGIAVDEVDPAFRASPALRGLMRIGRFDGRNTLTQRSLLGGGSLKILSAMAPRNLRRHTAKILFADEIDGMQITKEGDPLKLLEKRGLSYAGRKMVCGSTPTDADVSLILKRYENTDKRIFEVPCPHCGTPFEILWEHINWPAGKPELAVCTCPHCGADIEEREKPSMVAAGEWRTTNDDPLVKGRAGFRLNALISLFANASWAKLAVEFLVAKKNGPADMMVFYNTVLGMAWSTSLEKVSEFDLMARREDFGLYFDTEAGEWREDIPEDVLFITVGVDVQADRFECALVGWSAGHRWFLGHHIIRGMTNLESTWQELDSFLLTRWKHPLGREIGIEAAAIDSGDGNRTQWVYDFCLPRQHRKVVAIKGQEGPRPYIEASKNKGRRRKRTMATLFLVGVDQVKADIASTLPAQRDVPQSFRYSSGLDEEWFFQFLSEPRKVHYERGRPVIRFERLPGRVAEVLDGNVYGIAVRNLCNFDFDQRRKDLVSGPKKQAVDFGELSRRLNS